MNRHYCVTLLCVVLAVAGCGSNEFGEPYEDVGPIPFTGTGSVLTRYQQTKTHPKIGRIDRTLWSMGGPPVDPMTFVDPLIAAIPDSLHAKLRETEPIALPGGGSFNRPVRWARATVVSIRPNVLVVTVRELPKGSDDHPFEDFIGTYCSKQRRGRLITQMELLDCPDASLCINSGKLLPYSDDMYIVTTDPQVDGGQMTFQGDSAVLKTPAYSLKFTRHDNDVSVHVE